jgi:hypothetical protein
MLCVLFGTAPERDSKPLRVGRMTLAWASVLSPETAGSLGLAVRPRNGGDVFRYRLHSPDGDDLGEATYAMMIKPGEEIHLGAGQRFRVLDVVPFEEEDESRSSVF